MEIPTRQSRESEEYSGQSATPYFGIQVAIAHCPLLC